MDMIVLDQDIKNVQPMSVRKVFPEGLYMGQITGWKTRVDKNSNYHVLFKWQLEGQPEPLLVKYYLRSPNYPAQAQKGLGRLKVLCELFGAPCINRNGQFIIDPAPFMNKPCQLYLRTWEFNGRQGNYIESFSPIAIAVHQTSIPETASSLQQKDQSQGFPADLNDNISW